MKWLGTGNASRVAARFTAGAASQLARCDKPVSVVRVPRRRTLRMMYGRLTDCVTIRSSALIFILTFGVTQLPSVGLTQPFEPVSKLTTWYTDRNPIDVEIIATAGQGVEARRLEPERALRFRLERAYLSFVLQIQQPLTSSVLMSFDMHTGLPSELLIAPPEQVEARGDEIPRLDHAASVRRTLNIKIESQEVIEVLKRVSSEINRCRGENQGNDLFLYEKSREESCKARSFGSNTKYIARLSDDVSLLIRCSRSHNINCEMSFPFEGFVPSVSFHDSQLSSWREVVDKATSFLRSKQFR